jgi:hypothetical protein
MKTYTVNAKNSDIEVWYDRSLRLWTAIKVNDMGYQISDAAYSPTKDGAIEDVNINDIWHWLA